MKKIKILDKEFQTFLSAQQINKEVGRISSEINSDYKGKTPVILSILNGAFVFTADLIKQVNCECQISFLKVASYKGLNSTGKLKEFIGLDIDLKDKDVIIVEDIVDSGNTISNLTKRIKASNPTSIKIASLLFKPDAYKKDIKIDYVGFEIPDNFVLGYGLDYNGFGRNLDSIYCLI